MINALPSEFAVLTSYVSAYSYQIPEISSVCLLNNAADHTYYQFFTFYCIVVELFCVLLHFPIALQLVKVGNIQAGNKLIKYESVPDSGDSFDKS